MRHEHLLEAMIKQGDNSRRTNTTCDVFQKSAPQDAHWKDQCTRQTCLSVLQKLSDRTRLLSSYKEVANRAHVTSFVDAAELVDREWLKSGGQPPAAPAPAPPDVNAPQPRITEAAHIPAPGGQAVTIFESFDVSSSRQDNEVYKNSEKKGRYATERSREPFTSKRIRRGGVPLNNRPVYFFVFSALFFIVSVACFAFLAISKMALIAP
uniref:LEM domain-containing protein n=1 Tax=Steinernema glaseri TaxID=37863 RepID=A0A1I7Z2B7_9BILA